MKKTILICTILIFSAVAVVKGQTITTAPTQAKKEQRSLTPGDKVRLGIDQKAVQPANDNPKNLTADEKAAQGADQQKQNVSTDNAKNAQRLGEHGPYLNDPDFAAKKAEWIKNYPDEYKNSQKQQTITNPTK